MRSTSRLMTLVPQKHGQRWVIGAAALIGLFLMAVFFLGSGCARLSCISADGSQAWLEQERYKQTDTSYRALWKAPQYMIRVEKTSRLTAKDAALLIQVDTMRVQGLFDQARSPYPGAVSDRIRCDNEYRPVITHVKNGTLDTTRFETWLNDRLQPGSCLTEDKKYRSFHLIFYCRQQQSLYHLEFITGAGAVPEQLHQTLDSAACRP